VIVEVSPEFFVVASRLDKTHVYLLDPDPGPDSTIILRRLTQSMHDLKW